MTEEEVRAIAREEIANYHAGIVAAAEQANAANAEFHAALVEEMRAQTEPSEDDGPLAAQIKAMLREPFA